MRTSYSNNSIHKFIRNFIESDNGVVEDVHEDYFTIKTRSLISPAEYTYKAAIAHEKKIDLIATGSPAFNGIIDECLKDGILCSVDIKSNTKEEDFLKSFFKNQEYHCEYCEKIPIKEKDIYFCTKNPKCYHKINNAKISTIKIIQKKPIKLAQFFYSIYFNNKLKKSEELISILLDEYGNHVEADVLNNDALAFSESNEIIDLNFFDRLNPLSNEILDKIIDDKKKIFNLQLKKEIDKKLISLEKKLDDQVLEQSISKKWKFDEQEWIHEKGAILSKEKDDLETFVNVKFLNLLILKTYQVSFEITLDNNSSIKSSFLLGVDRHVRVSCPFCNREFSEGYGTEDGYYVCLDCINQSIETKNIYSKNFILNKDNTSGEYIEKDKGFICSVCKKQNSTLFEYHCNYNNSKVCYNCFDYCSKCGNIFSLNNLNKTKNTSKLYCHAHIIKCDNCKILVGIDEARVCYATGTSVCSCTKFAKCSLCDQEYSEQSLRNGKCPACNNITEQPDEKLIYAIKNNYNKFIKVTKWSYGKNNLNNIVIAKGWLSDTLLVEKDGIVLYEKKISLVNKLKGY